MFSIPDISQASPITIDISGTASRDNSEPIWVFRAAIDTTLATGSPDRVGSLQFMVVLDCYSFHWNADVANLQVGLNTYDQALENKIRQLMMIPRSVTPKLVSSGSTSSVAPSIARSQSSMRPFGTLKRDDKKLSPEMKEDFELVESKEVKSLNV